MALIECVPNFSEGRDLKHVSRIAAAIKQTAGIQLLHVDTGFSANRTVMTFVGQPEAVVLAAFRGISMAADLIDMQTHEGTHPCIGATDVCPLIPVSGISLPEVIRWAAQLGKRVGEKLHIPVYLYEESARFPERANLAFLRKGGYQSIISRTLLPQWKPDFGKPPFRVSAGATVVGARDFLIAYNVNLNTNDVSVAKRIASQIRTAGNPSALPYLKAIGWGDKEKKIAQVSMNLTNYCQTGLHDAFVAVKEAAGEQGIQVTGSELIGLTPLQALTDAGRYFYNNENKYHENQQNDATLIAKAINSLGLNEWAPFDFRKRILEYMINENGMRE